MPRKTVKELEKRIKVLEGNNQRLSTTLKSLEAANDTLLKERKKDKGEAYEDLKRKLEERDSDIRKLDSEIIRLKGNAKYMDDENTRMHGIIEGFKEAISCLQLK